MIKYVKLLFLVICMIFILSGCWDSQEFDQRALVGGIGVDFKDEKYNVTSQFIPAEAAKAVIGGTTSGDPSLIWNITTKGNTVKDTLFETKTITGRNPSFSHTRALIFSKELAERGLLETLDYLKRTEEIRRRAWVIITEDDVDEILATENKLNIIPAYGLSEIMESGPKADIAAIDLHTFSKKVSCKSSCAYAPIIHLEETFGKEVEASSSKNKKESGSDDQKSIKKQLDAHNTAVFDDFQLIGILNREETRGLMWLNDLLNVTSVDIQSPSNSSKLINLTVNILETYIKPEIKNDTIVMKVKLIAGGYMSEKHDRALNTSDPAVMFKLDKELNKVIEKEINMALHKAQSLKADIFDFGDMIHKYYPKEWDKIQDNWKEVFPEVQVEFEFDTKISWSGRVENNG